MSVATRTTAPKTQIVENVYPAAGVSVAVDRLLPFVGVIWIGIMAGFFWSFTSVVMPGLDDADPLVAMASMQAINDAVQNVIFAVGFFGAPIISLALIAHALFRRTSFSAWIRAAAAVIYIAGAFLVTVRFNVPLNNDLATLDPSVRENASAMREYIDDWSFWNAVRTISSVLAFVLLAASLMMGQVRLMMRSDGPTT